MKTITVLFAVFALAVGSGYAIAADDSASAAKSDIQKLVGTWKGFQGAQRNAEATYTFWIEEGRLLGRSEYLNTKKQERKKGVLNKINLSGDKLEFVVEYSDGTTGIYELTLEGSTLKGRARKPDASRALKEAPVFLKKSD